MNTNNLKRFAQNARRKLLQQVSAKLGQVLHTDSAELREKTGQLRKLREAINATSKEQVIDKVAYTWFNRLMALRFMDANDYQPIGVRVITPKDGYTLPEILDEAKQGQIPDELPVKAQHIYDLLDGRINATNAQNEAYKELLIGACNHLNKVFPFLFERIDDYAELLLPDDLTSEFSIVQDVREGMTTEDCREVEIIGWLYQFYISEKKDEVFASKSKVKKEDIPAATQLFTPRWIVEYMVQNTVGKLWLQNRPGSRLREHMPYFIDSPSLHTEDYLKVSSVEELTLLDQACGSGHILVYGFELFTKIYEEEGYNPSEIPQLIIENNLFGYEIDERAAQLAGLALMMKAKSYQRRLFRKEVKPNILCYKDMAFKVYPIDGCKDTFKLEKNEPALNDILKYGYCIAEDILQTWKESFIDEDTGEPVVIERSVKQIKKGQPLSLDKLGAIKEFAGKEISIYKDELKDIFREAAIPLSEDIYDDLLLMLQATNLGSLIAPRAKESDIAFTLFAVDSKLDVYDLFISHGLTQVKTALIQLQQLQRKHHCIVDNPPYMGGGAMNTALADFVKNHYPDSKADLMACFMEAGLKNLHPKGFLGMINQHSWMFLSSYENLRKKLLQETFIDTLLHLGPRTFPEIGGEVVQNASFTFWNTTSEEKGSFVRMVDAGSSELKRTKTLEAIQNPNCGWFYTANQKDFEKIPGSPIGYWVTQKFLESFQSSKFLSDSFFSDGANKTGNNDKYLRYLWEVNFSNICNINNKSLKWLQCAKGGAFRRWSGNIIHVINWSENTRAHYSKDKVARLLNKKYWFKEGITWGRITSSENIGFRLLPINSTYETAGTSIFSKVINDKTNILEVLGLLNSKVLKEIFKVLNPTLVTQVGNVISIPRKNLNRTNNIKIISEAINISDSDWSTHEFSLNFLLNELIRIKGQDIEEAYDLYQQYWKNKFFQLHQNEEELNSQFIEIYGLQEELTPDVPLEDITILKEELNQKELKKLSDNYRSGWVLINGKWYLMYGDEKIENGGRAIKGREELTEAVKNNPLTEKIWRPSHLPFNAKEIFSQFISYAVGCMFGRYSLDKEGLVLANQGETLEDYMSKVFANGQQPTAKSFLPDDDNIIPILDDEWFEDDIVGRFYEFLKASFGKENFEKNLHFIEDALGKDIRKYFAKDFYADHIKRYKKRPIYWMFSSPKGSFNVLIYMHRYTPDTLNLILNNYLKEYREKLNTHVEQLDHLIVTGSSAEQTKASKEKDRINAVLLELQEYERDVLRPLATDRIPIDLDDGVLVNYNKFGKAIKEVSGLNDKVTKKKVKEFDWIDGTKII